MCRVFGCVAADPRSIRHELLDAENPLIRQSEEHDSGWGMAVYERAEGGQPRLLRYPHAAHAHEEFVRSTNVRGRIFNAHVRRATMGGLALENTHPLCMGNYSFCHNGTVLEYPRLLTPAVRAPEGDTDSEHMFNNLMSMYDPADPVASLRRMATDAAATGPFSGLNFLFSDGERLFAYRLGIFELHWLSRPGQLLVASEKVTDEAWHTVAQDVLLVLNPNEIDDVHAERLLGDEIVGRADIRKFHEGHGLRGAERGAFAAERAARTAGASSE